MPQEGAQGENKNMGFKEDYKDYKDDLKEEVNEIQVEGSDFWAEHKTACIFACVVAAVVVGFLLYL